MGLGRDKGRRRRLRGLFRALRWLAILPVANRIPMYARLVWALALDPRVPASRKAILAAAAGYVVLGRDIISDDLPILGAIDDVAVVVLAVELFLDGVPDDVLDEKLDELAIDREAFHRDMDQVRRVLPGPVRRLVERLPAALEAAARLVKQSGIGPKLRSRITREGSFA